MSEINSVSIYSRLSPSILNALATIPPSSHYIVALSGGMDSILLLHAIVAYLRNNSPDHVNTSLTALHVHHGLSVNADGWANHCERVCQQLEIPFICERVEVVSLGHGLEAAARDARYEVFERHLPEGGVLLMGHHQDDQAETVLMKLFKGITGIAASGMPRNRSIGNGSLYRPFLDLTRKQLTEQAEQMELKWVCDESNSDTQFDRNFIRNDILPTLSARWPAVVSSIARHAEFLVSSQEENEWWCKRALQDVQGDTYQKALILERLLSFPAAIQRSIVRQWLKGLLVEFPSDKIYERIWSEVIPAAPDAQPQVVWGKHSVRRFDGRLYYVSIEEESFNLDWSTDSIERLRLHERVDMAHGNITLSNESLSDASICLKAPAPGVSIRIVNRSGGESIVLSEKVGTQALKKLLQQYKVPPWYRSRIMLVYFAERLVYAGLGKGSVLDLYAQGYEASSVGEDARYLCIEAIK